MIATTAGDDPGRTLRTGQCLCGAVRFSLRMEPLTVYACHCTDCQRLTASACTIAAIVPRDGIEIVAGEPIGYRAKLSDGRVRLGSLCRDCGTRLWGISQRQPALAVLYASALDDPSWARPAAHLWMRSAQPWIRLTADVPSYATQPEDAAVLVTHWREQRDRLRERRESERS